MAPPPVCKTALSLALSLIVLAPVTALAQTVIDVNSEAQLRAAIFQASNDVAVDGVADGGPYTINITDNITLAQSLPMIRAVTPGGGAVAITINGGGFTIDASNQGRVFFVESGVVAINNVSVFNAVAQGGNGGASEDAGGGGGGLGAGAAVFVYTGANVTLSNVSVTNASAVGGSGGGVAGGDFGGGGGGGLGGNGGLGGWSGGGGGGFAGAGGNSGSDAAAGAGGGGGEFGSGGNGATVISPVSGGGGGGGGGQQGNGGSSFLDVGGGGGGGATVAGSANVGDVGGAGGAPQGGVGGGSGGNAGPGAPLGGGGGGVGVGIFDVGGTGGASGGGGGAGGNAPLGGIGGIGGGGGGGTTGGAGGAFGGGGGGASLGAAGGYGGGGGGGTSGGGAGGFGGGGGSGNTAGAAGTFGGAGETGTSPGGGGAALGGAVFVANGGTLTITDGTFSGTRTVTGGTGAHNGQALGNTIFLHGTTSATTLDVGGIQTISGMDAIAGNGGLTKSGAGVLVVSGANPNYSGATTITGGAVAIDAGNSLGTGSVTLDNAALWTGAALTIANDVVLGAFGGTVDTNSTASTLSGDVSGGGGLVKVGTGTLTLSGTNTYIGGTTINGGTLGLTNNSSLGAGSLTIQGSNVDYADGVDIANPIDLQANAGLIVNVGSATQSGVISETGGSYSIFKSGAGTLTLSGTNTYSGGTFINGGTLHLANNSALGSGNLTILGSDVSYADGVDIATPIELQVNAGLIVNTGSATQSGAITEFGGSFGIAKTGLGTLTLSGANTYTGATTVSEGTLRAGAANVFGVNSATTVDWGTTLDLNGFTQTLGSLEGAGAVTLGTALLAVGTNDLSTTFSGQMSGLGSLFKVGAGTLTLSGANSYGGGTTVDGGALRLANNDALGTGGLTMFNFSGVEFADGLSVTNGIDLQTDITMAVGFDESATHSGVIGETGGPWGITLFGGGTLTLSGANTYTGATFVDDGTLRAGAVNVFGVNSAVSVCFCSTLDLNNFNQTIGSLDGEGNVWLGSATLTVGTNNNDSYFLGEISGLGSLAKVGTGTLALWGPNSYSGGTTVTAGAIAVGDDFALGDGDVTLDGGTLIAAPLFFPDVILSNNITLGAGNGTIDTNFTEFVHLGTISGDGSLSVVGGGIAFLTGNNTYTGDTIVDGSLVVLEHDNALGTTGALKMFDFSGVEFGDGVTIANDITLQGDFTIMALFGATATHSGDIGESGGSFGVFFLGPGAEFSELTLSGANTYTGATFVAGVRLRAGAENVFGVNSAVFVCDCDSTLDLNGFNQTIGSLGGFGNVWLGTATLTVGTDNTDSEFEGIISGTGGLTKTVTGGGTGILTLFGSNTYTGATNVLGGTLRAGATNVFGVNSAATVGALGTLDLNDFNQTLGSLEGQGNVWLGAATLTVGTNNDSTDFFGEISGAGSLAKVGGGTLTLFGANTYGGGTTINGGTLGLANNSALGSGNLTILGSDVAYADGVTIGNPIDLQANAGVIVDTGNATQAGVISETGGSYGIVKTGAGTLTLSGANTYTGGTTILEGALAVTNNDALGTGDVTLDGGALRVDTSLLFLSNDIALGAGNGTIDTAGNVFAHLGSISGAGSLSIAGAGISFLFGDNTYTGGTSLEGGSILGLLHNNALGTEGLTILGNSAVIFGDGLNVTNAITLQGNLLIAAGANTNHSGVIGESGGSFGISLLDGDLTLSGANTYTGATNAYGGILRAGAANVFGVNSATDVCACATLDLNGFNQTLGSLVGAGNVTLGTAALTVGTNLTSTLFSGIISGNGSLTKTGTGTLTLSGANTYAGGTTVNAGTLRAGAANVFGGGAATVGAGATLALNGFNQTLGSLAGAGNVTLGSAALTTGGNNTSTTFSGVMSGTGSLTKTGTGTLTLGGVNTYSGGTTVTGGGAIVLGSSNAIGAGPVTLDGGTLRASSDPSLIPFVFNNVSLGPGHGAIDTAGSVFALYGTVSGPGSLSILGGGSTAVGGNNTYTGGTSLVGGALFLDHQNALGTGGLTVRDNGTPVFNNGAAVVVKWGVNIANAMTLQTNTFLAGGDFLQPATYSGVIGESGGSFGITVGFTGNLTLSGANTYTGATIVESGVLRAGAANVFGINSATTVNAGATLALQGFNHSLGSLAGAGNVTLGSATLTVGGNHANTLFSGVLSGAGALTKVGTGILTLSGNNTYAGGTTLAGGLVNITSGDNLGTGAITFAGGGVQFGASLTLGQQLIFTPAGAVLDTNGFEIGLSNVINGSGGLTKLGLGTLFLTGANTYTGGTTVLGGTLAGNTTSLQGNIFNHANVLFDQGLDGTYAGIMSGSGSLTKTGAGILFLTGANSYTGGTIVSAGTLAGTTTGLQGNILNNAAVRFDQTSDGTYAGLMSGGGSLTKNGGGTLFLTGANTYTGGTIVNAGTLSGTATSIQGNIFNNAAVVFNGGGTYGGAMSGGGTLTKDGGGILTLTGGNSYSGGTFVNAGTLAGNTTSLQGTIVNQSAVVFDQAFNGTYAGSMIGGGSLTKNGGGVVTLAGPNGYSGGTFVNGGTLAGTTVSLQGAILNNAGVVFDQAFDGIYAGVMSGSGSLAKNGDGILLLTGANTYSGGTTVSGGALVGTTTSLQGNVLNNAAVVFDQAFNGTYTGLMSGSGGLMKFGPGTLTLTAAHTYTGGTFITGGTLAGNTTSLRGGILNNASLLFNQGFNGTFAGVLEGTGTMFKAGAGALTLNGTHFMTGLTTVQEGTLILNGALPGSVAVVGNANFIGTGFIGGTLTATGGTTSAFAPEPEIALEPVESDRPVATAQRWMTAAADVQSAVAALGRLDVAQNVVLGPGATYNAAVTAAGQSTLLAAGGSISLQGATIVIDAGQGPQGRVMQTAIMTAGGGFSGTPTVLNARPTLESFLVNDGRNLFVTMLNTEAALAPYATTANGAAAGRAFDRISVGATGDRLAGRREMAALSDDQLGDALDQVSGEIHASAIQLAALDGEAATDAVRDEITRRAGAGLESGSANTPWGGGRRYWGRFLGQRANFDADGTVHGGDASLGGFALGLDWTLGTNWLAGAGGGYGDGRLTLDDREAESEMQTPRAFGYVGYGRGRWVAQAGGGAAWASYDTSRSMAFVARLDPRFGGRTLFGGIDREALGDVSGVDSTLWSEWRTTLGSAWTAQPAVGVRYARYGRSAWTETGADSLSLAAPSQTLVSTQADLGMRVARRTGRFLPSGSIAYRRELTDGRTTTTLQFGDGSQGQYDVEGLRLPLNVVTAGVGMTFRTRALDLLVNYDVRPGSGQTRQTLQIGMEFK